jgi:hypothetical protein
MRGRDVAILAGVLLVAGFAIADSLRGEGEERPAEPATTTAPGTTTSPTDPDLGRARFSPVAGADGELVFTETGSCAVREFDVASGQESPNVVQRSTCDLWAAPAAANVAVGIGPVFRDAVPFRLVDLARPDRSLGGFRALFGFLAWSPDGRRAAWCGVSRVGFDLELGGPARRLPECPAAYTSAGEIAYARGRRLLVEERREVLRASGGITSVHYGRDGSVAVVVEGRRLERYLPDGRRDGEAELAGPTSGRIPVFSPDNCAALVRARDNVRLLDLGCSPFRRASFPGTTAAWSPDGEWIAVAGPDEITFRDLAGGGELTWPVGAARIFWR